jgi:hypothetical protein
MRELGDAGIEYSLERGLFDRADPGRAAKGSEDVPGHQVFAYSLAFCGVSG